MNFDTSNSARARGVWIVRVDAASALQIETLRGSLSSREQARLDALRNHDDKVGFAAAHVLTRVALSQLFPIPAEDWNFDYTELGKPFAVSPHGYEDIHFSLSHTRGLVGCAVARTPVGIDLEALNHDLDVDSLIASTIAPHELAQLSNCAPKQKVRRFLSLWTLKEALSKALGVGLNVPFSKIVIELGTADAPQLVDMPASLGDTSRWNLRVLDCGVGHLGAVVDSEPQSAVPPCIGWLKAEALSSPNPVWGPPRNAPRE
jgi:4'-phosphopantetheinyl transferase